MCQSMMDPEFPLSVTAQFLWDFLQVLSNWKPLNLSGLADQVVRLRLAEDGKVLAVGHAIQDRWAKVPRKETPSVQVGS